LTGYRTDDFNFGSKVHHVSKDRFASLVLATIAGFDSAKASAKLYKNLSAVQLYQSSKTQYN